MKCLKFNILDWIFCVVFSSFGVYKNDILRHELIRCHYDIKIYKIFQRQKQHINIYIYIYIYIYIFVILKFKNLLKI